MMRSLKTSTARAIAAALTTLGLAVALTGCGSVYDLPLPGGADVGSNPLKIHILFKDVADLVPQSSVKVNDVSVGRVTAIELQGQVANVTVEIPRSTDLPANATATIRQTSLLGEKFVSLKTPAAPEGHLTDGATIGLKQSGSTQEVEQVLKAMGALLSGGGVGQLKVISEQLNAAIGGKEEQVKQVLHRLHYFMGQLSGSKNDIVTAIDNLNRLAVSLKKQDPTIVSALDNIPAALASVDSQRSDLVKMLGALNKLSTIGVQVIQESKAATIDSLTNLSPVLAELAAAGDNLPKSFQIFLTYPFVDATVGTTPVAARNFEMGDYTNLSITLDLDLMNLSVPGLPGLTLPGLIQICKTTPALQLCDALSPIVDQLCSSPLSALPICPPAGTTSATTKPNRKPGATTGSKPGSKLPSLPNLLGGLGGGGTSTNSGGLLGGLGGLLGLGRPAYGATQPTSGPSGDGMSYLLMQGAAQ